MPLFSKKKPKIVKAGGLWPPTDMGGGHVLKVCLEGIDDPSAHYSTWSSTEPEWDYRTWTVHPSDGSGRYEVDSTKVLNILYRDCSSMEEFTLITGTLKAEFERIYGRRH